jgi:tRNA modification GTPase
MGDRRAIVAVASAPGPAARGIVRASGAGCMMGVQALLEPGCAPDVAARGVHVGRLVAPLPPIAVLVIAMPGPASATGEDCVEIHAPGNPVLLERIVDALVAAGEGAIRRAAPGEFSARAVLSGRMPVAEAERVAAAIAAETDAQLQAAAALRANAAGQRAAALAEDLALALALVEAGIDFTDQEDVQAIAPGELERRLAVMHASLQAMLARAGGAEQARRAARVVLAGPPNAGKSSLFNALLGRARMVEAPERGTTRDAVEEALEVAPGVEVLLVDAPGLDEATAAIDHLMQSRARAAIERADVVLACEPVNSSCHSSSIFGAEAAQVLHVATKADDRLAPGSGAIATSARTGRGLNDLRAAIADAVTALRGHRQSEESALGAAQTALLHEAVNALDEAIATVREGRGPGTPPPARLAHPELVAASLRTALDRLGEVAGAIPPDDVLGRLFSSFCIGK